MHSGHGMLDRCHVFLWSRNYSTCPFSAEVEAEYDAEHRCGGNKDSPDEESTHTIELLLPPIKKSTFDDTQQAYQRGICLQRGYRPT